MQTLEKKGRELLEDWKEISDIGILQSIQFHSRNKGKIGNRLAELEKEWDLDKAIELNAAILFLAGSVLGLTTDKRWLVLPGLVAILLAQRALQGWSVTDPVFRALDFRTRNEIAREIHGLKALLGEYRKVRNSRKLSGS